MPPGTVAHEQIVSTDTLNEAEMWIVKSATGAVQGGAVGRDGDRVGLSPDLTLRSNREVRCMFTRITVRPEQMGGVPCIRGLRIPVSAVVGMAAEGMSEREILDAYPDLEPDDIHEALRFAAAAVRERQLPLVTVD